MSHPSPAHATLEAWIAREALQFSVDSPETFHAAVDTLIAALGTSVALLGLGEALHGGEGILQLRNQLFQHLVVAHGYSAIAIESSFPQARAVNEYIAGSGAATYAAVQASGFSHGFGQLDANRELVEWMRQYNAEPSRRVKLHFYGFDSPTEMTGTDSPSHVLHFALDYLASLDPGSGQRRRERIDSLLGADADWENPAALMDPAQSVGLSAAASMLRVETEDLITELQIRRPELVAQSAANRYWEALQYALIARQLLSYHATVARASDHRVSELLGMRDAMMADNLAYIVSRERGRGKVLAFAHNRHVQRGKAVWQLGPQRLSWWPAGAQLNQIFGPRYAVIGSGLATSEANGIGQPEPGTLEALLTRAPTPAVCLPTHQAEGLPAAEIAALPIRSGSSRNSTYFALGPESFTDFDWLVVLATTGYSRGGPPLP
ncbi:MAG: erythromycin esterase family protein [Kouleothrix sp.]